MESSPKPSWLLGLSEDLLLYIFRGIEGSPELARLCIVSKLFNRLCEPLLYSDMGRNSGHRKEFVLALERQPIRYSDVHAFSWNTYLYSAQSRVASTFSQQSLDQQHEKPLLGKNIPWYDIDLTEVLAKMRNVKSIRLEAEYQYYGRQLNWLLYNARTQLHSTGNRFLNLHTCTLFLYDGRSRWNLELMSDIFLHSTLRYLTIIAAEGRDDALKTLLEHPRPTKLKELHFKRCKISPTALVRIVAMAPSLRKLTIGSLMTKYVSNVGDEASAQESWLLALAPVYKSLQTLVISPDDQLSYGEEDIFKLAPFHALRELEVDSNVLLTSAYKQNGADAGVRDHVLLQILPQGLEVLVLTEVHPRNEQWVRLVVTRILEQRKEIVPHLKRILLKLSGKVRALASQRGITGPMRLAAAASGVKINSVVLRKKYAVAERDAAIMFGEERRTSVTGNPEDFFVGTWEPLKGYESTLIPYDLWDAPPPFPEAKVVLEPPLETKFTPGVPWYQEDYLVPWQALLEQDEMA